MVLAEEVASSTWKYPELKRICACESVGNPNAEPIQFNKEGTVLRGVINKADTGMCQLNTKYHLATAQKLGLDIFTAEGNKGYAEWLYEQEGNLPWHWSKHCWDK